MSESRKFPGRAAALGVLAVLGASRAAFAQIVPPNAGRQWATTFSSEFNTGPSDLTGWTYDVGAGGWGNNEYQTYTNTAQNSFVSTDQATGGSGLTIRAIGIQAGQNVNYTSARIRTPNLFSQTYGLWEFRAKMPIGNGLWPALWMMPKDNAYGGWPTSGEIDIFEGKGQDQGWAQSTLHSGPSGNDFTQSRTFQESGLRPPGFTTADWHTYSLKWDAGAGTGPSTFTFYVDGVAYHTRTGGWSVPAGQPSSAPFDKPFYIIMNMAVGGNYVNGQHPGAGTYDMKIDYSRAYTSIPSAGTPTWKSDVSGNWSNPANWNNAVVPNSVNAIAQFGNVLTQPRTVTVDTPLTAGRLVFSSLSGYTIGGSQTLTLQTSGAAVQLDVTAGDHLINAPLLLLNNTTVTVTPPDSTVQISSLSLGGSNLVLTKAGDGVLALRQARSAGVVLNGGAIDILPDGTNAGTSRVATISIAGGADPVASLDLNNNDLIVTTTPRSTIEAAIRFARGSGDWIASGGITSSAARIDPDQATALGVLSGSEWLALNPGTPFDGFSVAAADTLVKYTWYGDADFSGAVDFDDYIRADNGFNQGLSGWANGDFNLDGSIDFDDFVLIDLAFNAQTGTLLDAIGFLTGEHTELSAAAPLQRMREHAVEFGPEYVSSFLSAVPEPSAGLGLLALSQLIMSRRSSGRNRGPHSAHNSRRTNAKEAE